MTRITTRLRGMFLAGAAATLVLAPARAGTENTALGSGKAYELLGKVPVMHEGRVKPLDTVAREEIKQVYSRETIKLRNLEQEITDLLDPEAAAKRKEQVQPEAWGHVGAFLGWTINPDFWDEQAFLLVDYLPLRRRVLAQVLASRLKGIAAKSTTPVGEKTELEKLAASEEVSGALLTQFVKRSKLPTDDRRTIAELALKLDEEHKWLAPRELEEAEIVVEGHKMSFVDWAADLHEQQRRFNANPQSAPRLTEVERRAVEVAMRLQTYKGYSGEGFVTSGIVLMMPRPFNAKWLAATNQAIKAAREQASERDVPLLARDEIKAFGTYWNDVPRDDRHFPTEDATFDEHYSAWLRDNSAWLPLKVMLKSQPKELIDAGYPEAEVQAFLNAYHALAQAESSSPGRVSGEPALGFLNAARALGEAVNPTKYPTTEAINRETHFNSMNPFWEAPYAYGAAVLLLLLGLGFTSLAPKPSLPAVFGATLSRIGVAALAVGIGLEMYGFYLRVRISGWAPVTNMYETVIWVAMIAAVLSFIFEMIYRRAFFALAGSAVALLGTITAANVPLLDPSIKSLQPVLRSNLWLTIHVLTEVSSYAAFGLAWALGMITSAFYLTATYRRSPRWIELALILLVGVPVLAVGWIGLAACSGMLGPKWSIGGLGGYSSSQPAIGSDNLYYMFAVLALLGESLTLAGLLALAGEGINRLMLRKQRVDESTADSGSTTPVPSNTRTQAMQRTAAIVKPLSNFVYRTMQVGVLLIAAGTILGGVWADYSWGRFWGWDPKEVWALITLLVYLIPLHGRFAGWVNTFGLTIFSVVCFLSVVMAWYGVNFVLGVGLHSYGFVEGGSQGIMAAIIMGVMGLPVAAAWRRSLAQRPAQSVASHLTEPPAGAAQS
jgi:ABC-type transport system involved in cytochrome c biogenesis permease subunit